MGIERRAREGSKPPAAVEFYLVRHGKTLFNLRGRVQGWCDAPLTDEGVRMARELGRGLSHVEFSAAFSSDAGRAERTLREVLGARAAARGEDAPPFHPESDVRLREWCYGDIEGKPGKVLNAALRAGLGGNCSFEECNRRLPEAAAAIAAADSSGRAETFEAIEARLGGFLKDAAARLHGAGGGNALVVTHSFAIRTLVYLLDKDRVNEKPKIRNLSITRISYDGCSFELGEIGSTRWLGK